MESPAHIQCAGSECPMKCKRRHPGALFTHGRRDHDTNLWACEHYEPDLRPGVWETGEKRMEPIRQAVRHGDLSMPKVQGA